MVDKKIDKEYDSISIHWGHDSSISFVDKDKKIRVFEYERFCKIRYATLVQGFYAGVAPTSEQMIIDFFEIVKKYIYQTIRKVYFQYGQSEHINNLITRVFGDVEFIEAPHHLSHAYGGYYMSGYKDALIFSLDGGGNDYGESNTFCIYRVKDGVFERIENKSDITVAVPYRDTSFLLGDIGRSDLFCGDWIEGYGIGLADPGKIMGLCAYGSFREEWISPFRRFFEKGGFFVQHIESLCSEIGVPFGFKSLKGQLEYDVAASMQEAFRRVVFENMATHIERENLDVIFVGGCALNVLYNQFLGEYLSSKNIRLFIPPNPSDCGVTHGSILGIYPELASADPYIGIDILDADDIETYLKSYEHRKVSSLDIAKELLNGKIIGVIDGSSEIGPRALGNRSIICYPSYRDMKDILNKKVKFREWYRPFAPVCRLDDKDIYFENAFDSRYMSYAPLVREEYRESLAAITHVDGTARLQTVTENTHILFNDILDSIDSIGNIPVILNTSFNIKGLPVLTTLKDAFYVLDNTELDYVLHNNILFGKNTK